MFRNLLSTEAARSIGHVAVTLSVIALAAYNIFRGMDQVEAIGQAAVMAGVLIAAIEQVRSKVYSQATFYDEVSRAIDLYSVDATGNRPIDMLIEQGAPLGDIDPNNEF